MSDYLLDTVVFMPINTYQVILCLLGGYRQLWFHFGWLFELFWVLRVRVMYQKHEFKYALEREFKYGSNAISSL